MTYFIKNRDMRTPKPLNEVLKGAIDNNINVILEINGEYYDIFKSEDL